MKNGFLFLLTVLIWGTTWLAIKFQLGVVPPMVSVAYRFFLAAVILLLYGFSAGLNMRFSLESHVWMALQGLLLFGFNYWLVYMAEMYLVSGLVAVILSTIVFLNILNSALFLKTPIQSRTAMGAFLGLGGVLLVFWPELTAFDPEGGGIYGLGLGLLAAYLSSLGNVLSARNQSRGLPVIQTNAYGMAYGCIGLVIGMSLTGQSFVFDTSTAYIVSLLYLALFGSVIAFGCFLTLVGRIGAGRAAYAMLLFPLVALGISTFVESYQWTLRSIAGVLVVLSGGLIVINPRILLADLFARRRMSAIRQSGG